MAPMNVPCNDLFKECRASLCLVAPVNARQRLSPNFASASQQPRGPHSISTSLLDAAQPSDPLFSHLPRFLSSRIDDFYTGEFRTGLGGIDVVSELRASLPTRFFAWSPLNKAAYLEMTTRLSPYLLSSSGDRMTMAHGVEGRYPFLDHRVFEFASALPTGSRLRGLRDKEVLRRWASRILPGSVNSSRSSYRARTLRASFCHFPSWVATTSPAKHFDGLESFRRRPSVG